jgi:hypothetical protein
MDRVLIHRKLPGSEIGQFASRLLRDREQGMQPMTVNMGLTDRIVRLVVGIVLIAYAIPIGFSSTGWNWVGWIGVVPILTALLGTCPLYTALGISTCPAKPR